MWKNKRWYYLTHFAWEEDCRRTNHKVKSERKEKGDVIDIDKRENLKKLD